MQRTKKRRGNPQREITAQQKKVNLVIPSAPFRRVVDELTQTDNIRYQQEAIVALQTAAEAYLVETFQDANALAVYNGRETLHNEDINLALRLKK